MKLRSGKDFSRITTIKNLDRKPRFRIHKKKDESARVAELEHVIRIKNIYIEELNKEIENLQFGLLLLILFIFIVPLVIFVTACS